MCHMDPYDKVPDNDVRGCHTSVVYHSSGYRYVQLQSSREADEGLSSMVYPCGGSTGAQQLSSLQRSSARRTRDAHSSTKLCICACTGETRPSLGGRWSWMMCVHTYMICQPSSDKDDIRLGGRAAGTGGHMRVSGHKVYRNSVSDLRTSFADCWTCRAEQSCHKDSA
jgi:hypothetical protein